MYYLKYIIYIYIRFLIYFCLVLHCKYFTQKRFTESFTQKIFGLIKIDAKKFLHIFYTVNWHVQKIIDAKVCIFDTNFGWKAKKKFFKKFFEFARKKLVDLESRTLVRVFKKILPIPLSYGTKIFTLTLIRLLNHLNYIFIFIL